MSSILQRTLVLSFARVSNHAILLLSPLILVRIFTPEQYGIYREFMVYATLAVSISGFAVNRSLTYLIPKYPQDEKRYVTQAAAFVFAFSLLGVAVVYGVRSYLDNITHSDIVLPLSLYILFFSNLDFWESYWLAKRNSRNVLLYSVGRLIFRISTVVSVAYISRDVALTISSVVAVEAVRLCLALIYALKHDMQDFRFTREAIFQQCVFFFPLGVTAFVIAIHKSIGQMVVSTNLGVASLALYVISMYVMQIVRVVRGAVADVIFPEIVEAGSDESRDSLALWKRTTVMYCFLLFPSCLVLFYHAEDIVVALFTETYIAAVPLFQIHLLMVILRCFDFNLPLRAINRTLHTLLGNVLLLVINISFLGLFFNHLGLLTPAWALVVAEVAMMIYLCWKLIQLTSQRLVNLIYWGEIGKLLWVLLLLVPVLVWSDQGLGGGLLGAIFSSLLYGGLYLIIIGFHGPKDVHRLLAKIRVQLKKSLG